jgi:very-short-patch-repair endonuclease
VSVSNELPTGWIYIKFDEAIDIVPDHGFRIKQKDYLPSGYTPVVDQGEGLIGGYTNDTNARINEPLPIIVFGDHTRRFKFINFPFAVGADGVKLFHPLNIYHPQFLFLQLGTIDLEDRGYGRHYQHLRKEHLVLPPISEQTRIVEKLEELLSGLDAGVAELKAAQKKLVQYRQSLLKAAVEGKLTEQWRNNRYTASSQYLTDQARDATANDTAANTPLSPRGRGAGGEGATTSGLPHNAWLRDRARELRKAQTPQEQALWQQLRAKRFSGFKFRRQQVIGRYIADFVCFEQKLVIELDGSQHSDTKQADAQRDHWLNGQGFRVLRFWNNQWQSQQTGVLEAIWQALHEDKPSPPLPNPSPTRGEGLSVVPDVDEKGRSGTQQDASFCLDERGAGEAVETGAQLLEHILKQRRAHWEAKQLTKFQQQGKTPPKGWQDKYPEPVKPDTTDLPELPEGWVWASLDMLGEIASGVAKGTKRDASIPVSEVPYLRVANVQRGYLELSEVKTILATKRDIEELTLQKGDILFNEGGDRDKLGRGWVWRDEVPNCIHQNHVFRMRPYLPELMPELISHHGNTFGKTWFQSSGKQTTNLASINMSMLRTFPVPVAPVDEQIQILSLLEEQIDVLNDQEKSVALGLSLSAAQRKNILKAAFSGQLVPQDPNDEPASVLLERIRAERATQTLNGKLRKRSTSNA